MDILHKVVRRLPPLLLAGMVAPALASERIYASFELLHNDYVINRGNDYVTKKRQAWSRGLKSSYLELRCDRSAPDKLKKIFSTVDHFAGLRVTHQLVEDSIEVTVMRSVVRNRRAEIRDLPKDQCMDLAPVVTTVTEHYTFPARAGTSETRPFGETMQFRFTVKSGGSRYPVIDRK